MSKVAITIHTVALAGALVSGLGLSPCFAADQASHLGGSVETLPASLDALFPPTAQGPVFLFKMHAMAGPFSGIMVDLMEQDLPNARSDFETFKREYVEIRAMVPEWTEHYPLQPVEELGKAMAGGAQPEIMAAFEKVGRVCSNCHASLITPVQQKYHWGNFAMVSVDDPLTHEKVGIAPFMHFMDAGLTGIPLNLSQGQLENARKSFLGFSTRFEALSQSCFNCHETEREYYVDDAVRGMIAKLDETLKAPAPDPEVVGSLVQGIGMESCFKCHLVHIPAATAQMRAAGRGH